MAAKRLKDDPEAQSRLTACLADAFAASSVHIAQIEILSGGAIQENWLVDLDVTSGPRAGRLETVLRTDSPTGVAVSHSRAQEFELLRAAHTAGVTVPEPLLCVTDLSVIGKEFCLMRRVAGTALGQKITRDRGLGGDREALTERLGREMALIHSITPDTHSFDFLPAPAADAALQEWETMRAHYDAMDHQRPVLEWAFRWLTLNRPSRIGSRSATTTSAPVTI